MSLGAAGRARQAASLSTPPKRPTIPLATIVTASDIPAATALNQAADSQPHVITELSRYLTRMHSENHTTAGSYNLWCGEKNKGTSPTSLGQKLTAAGMITSTYGHGSYVMQTRFEEAPDLEAHYPLAMAVFYPGSPIEARSAERLTVDLSGSGRDEAGFEGSSQNFWNARAPNGVSATIVTSSTPSIGTAPRNGSACLAVTMGASAGQMVASTGISSGTSMAAFEGMKVTGSLWVKAQTTGRSCAAEIRWLDASFATIQTSAGSASADGASWTQRTVTAVAPAGAAWFALQVRWTGPPANGETHYIDDASVIEHAARLSGGIDAATTTVQLYAAHLHKPTAGISSVNTGTDRLTANGHGLSANESVYFSGNNLPSPLVAGTEYFVRNPDTNTFQVAETAGGSVLDLTTTGAATSYSRAPDSWPFRAPRPGDPAVSNASVVSVSSAECVHWVRIDDEIMGITAVSGPVAGIVTLTVVRGMWGTTAASHADDAKVFAPVYVGSISEGADATFAGTPAVNRADRALRYVLALDQRLTEDVKKRATEWVAKRRIMEMLEFDRAGNPANVPQTTDPDQPAPAGWSGYASAGSDIKSVNALYVDITGTNFYNQSDSYGYDVRPWSLVGVPSVIDPDTMHTNASLAAMQIHKMHDFRSFMTTAGIPGPQYIIGNNLAAQANPQDPYQLSVIASGALDMSVLEFWLNNPSVQIAKTTAQRNQWMTICANDYKACVWAKSGQNGLVGTVFDSPPTGAGNISAADLAHYRRWCYGHFLLGWRGSRNQQFLTEWGLDYKSTIEQEFLMNLGRPRANYATWDDIPEVEPGVKTRAYTLGWVYVNTTGSPVSVTLPKPLRDLSVAGHPVVSTKNIGAYDAAFMYGA